jgi:molecular chaperone HscB
MKKEDVVAGNLFMFNKKPNNLVCFFCRHDNAAHNLFCANCNKILSATTDFFSKFGFPISFEIDINECKKRYLEMQSKVHPDLFIKKSQIEQTIALNCSSFLNDAYNTLKNDYKRSKYILKLHNIDLDKESHQYFINQTEFLSEIMDLTEAKAESRNEVDKTKINEHIENKKLSKLEDIKHDFKSGDIKKAAIDTIKLSYYHKASLN